METKTKYQIFQIISVVLVAIIGTIFVQMGMTWFNGLSKPSSWVPNYIIPIMWTIIYICAIISMFLLIKNDKMNKTLVIMFIINGVLNVLWSLVFFTLHWILIGEVVLILNLIAGWLLLTEMHEVDKLTSYILVVYPVWLMIALMLNTALWILN